MDSKTWAWIFIMAALLGSCTANQISIRANDTRLTIACMERPNDRLCIEREANRHD